ncbi:DUF3606 domain-containing protein [Tardiphaga sp. vice352]|uniref:DUF3606 domain-containing protein n=1 Tax=unclassified Tardiphaga TaxID=2631404 RepID=UPI001163A1AD|nr:DUF3606 domain-containing protein [Tardiphaga sp. vice278]QDM24684.1 DUF3606 domain-containing protein [Tardiphaga sp. vice154]QDM29880.1 DUF3606 domain-containing protein [Tardiphaga sp. vice304]QDM34970.1 DUF3606 domain-containing protein [Tardiphaga sp. vice352]
MANQSERDGSHISLQRAAETRFWTRHHGVKRAAREAMIAKVGNSATAMQRNCLRPAKRTQRPEAITSAPT